ncbi:MAG: alkaline phosphatase family protein [Chloroflexota bacterium]
MNRPKRAVVLGFDCAEPHLLQKHIDEGYLPAFKKVIETGVIAENCLAPYPTITPPNWTTIATGAWPGTHQITDFWVHTPGKTPENANAVQAYSSNRVKAEFIWDALDKAGKKCIVLNYPVSWPSHMKNGIIVGGEGLAIGSHHDGFPRLEIEVSLASSKMITTGFYPNAARGEFEPAEDWQNVDDLGEEPLEMAAELVFPESRQKALPVTWHVLARQSQGDGYDTVTLSPSKNFQDAFCTLKVGQWSAKITTMMKVPEGAEREVFFKVKLLELSEDAEDFRLFITNIITADGWASPPEAAKMIDSPDGVPVGESMVPDYTTGLVDANTYVELNELQSQWQGDAAVSFLKGGDWDLFYMHSHPIDWMYHVFLADMDPAKTSDPEKMAWAWDIHKRIYQSEDRLLARILEVLPEDTLVVLVSDHGATSDGQMFNPFEALGKAGLCVLSDKVEENLGGGLLGELMRRRGMGFRIDAQKSKAMPQRAVHIYVNLKGRDPEGIVEPEDYEKVQLEICDALYQYVDAQTGQRPVALALPKNDARLLGLYGDGIGDVIYAVYPWFGSQHGHKLPTSHWGLGSLAALLVFNGPGIKQGARLQRTVGLVDIVPTICHLTGLPLPADVEGAVIYQAFEDPDFKRHETEELTAALTQAEASLSGKQE